MKVFVVVAVYSTPSFILNLNKSWELQEEPLLGSATWIPEVKWGQWQFSGLSWVSHEATCEPAPGIGEEPVHSMADTALAIAVSTAT